MTENRKLTDPRTMFYSDSFEKQDQEAPALQQKMTPVPDCGESTYQGHEKLLNRRAFVTGGDSGIGRAAAIAYAKEGADVAIQYLPGEEADAQEVKTAIENEGRKALLLPYDFRDEDGIDGLIDQVVDELGGLDILVLNAAQQLSRKKITELDIQQVKDTFLVNIVAMFALVKAAKPHLKPGSAIITTTSVQGFNPSVHLMDYAASKAAISNFTINLAQELGEDGIRVNGVAPGPIWTPLQLDRGQPQDAIPEFGQDSLLKRAGQPVELAPVYTFLASDDASYVTGQIYGVTGGEPINL
ncbi:SDR family oxidoreductase [Agrilactobacillus fermenti]|uniref:SDR family oxidoreductase n=1 Tax=Agrilactobacillus fermenti TaxID=2586909 RepID=UPI003A5C4618